MMKNQNLSPKDMRRIEFWKSYPKWTPGDLQYWSTFQKADNPEGEIFQIQITNEHPEVNLIVTEPFGSADDFPFGTIYILAIVCNKAEVVEALATLPKTLLVSPAWKEMKTMTCNFKINGNSIVIYTGSESAIFHQDGTATMAFGR